MSVEPEIIEAETREIALRPTLAPAPVTLFGTEDPLEFVQKVTRVADALKDVITKKQLYSTIQGRQFVGVEGWTTVGSMVGVFPVLRWTRQIEVDGKSGWEARVEAVTRSGDVVGAAESMCLKGESSNWNRQANDNAVRSMAQTRATSKALRQPLDFLVKMAGYVATPAEEMDAYDATPAAGGQKTTRATAAPASEARDAASAAEPGPSPAQQAKDARIVAKAQKKHEEGAGAVRAAREASQEVEAEDIATLYQEIVELGVVWALKKNPDDPDSQKSALELLDRQCVEMWGFPLDKLNVTALKTLLASYRLKVEADV